MASKVVQPGAHDDEGQPEILGKPPELWAGARGAGARGNGGPRERSPRSVGRLPRCVWRSSFFLALLEQHTSSPHLPETRAVLGPRHSSLGLHIAPTA